MRTPSSKRSHSAAAPSLRSELPVALPRGRRPDGRGRLTILLHWRGSTPLEETVEAFHALVDAGKILYWGVSNFDVADMEELFDRAGRLLGNPALRKVADRHGATPAQVALAWVLRLGGVNAIPKAGTPAHVEENRAALDLRLGQEDLAELDRAFPPPTEKRPLEML